MSWRLLFGLLIIVLGAGFILGQTALVPAWEEPLPLLSYWCPLAIMAIALNQLFQRRDQPWGSLVVFAVGVIVFVRFTGRLPDDPMVFVGGVVMLAFGLRLLLPRQARRVKGGKSAGLSLHFDQQVKDLALFGGTSYRSGSQQFKGGVIRAVFGDYELDLSDAAVAGTGAEVISGVVFGSITVRVPESMMVTVSGKSFLGSVDNHASQIAGLDPGRPALRLHCTSVFGSISVTN